jgi:ribosome biogenesis protein BMS1
MKVVKAHTGDYSGLKSKATNLFSFNRDERIRWKHVIYGDVEEQIESDEDDLNVGGLLKRAKKSTDSKKQAFKDREDGFNYLTPSSAIFAQTIDWTDEDQRELIKNCFITRKNDQESDNDELDENDIFDEDELKMEVDDEIDESKISMDEEDQAARSKRLEAKEKLKARFNTEYDEHNEAYNTLKEENDAQAKVRILYFFI